MKQKSNDEVLNDIKRLNLAVDKKKQSNAPIAGKSAREGQVRSAGAHAGSEGGGGTLPSVTERRSHEPSFQVSSFPEPRKAGPRRRLEDTIAPVSPETGRLIVRYSWTNRFRAFSFLDMLGTMATIWNPKRDFFINRRFARSLLCGSGKHAGSVSLYSLSDTLEELSWIAGRLMGSWSSIHSASIVRELDKATGYVGVPYLGYFLSLDSAIFTDQSYLRQRFLEGDRIPVRALAWSVKCVWGLSLITEAVPLKTARRIVETAWEINRKVIENEYAGFAAQKRKLTEELALYPPVFLRLLENLRQFRKELYPALLFLIGGFYPYQDNTAEKRERILLLCGLAEEKLISLKTGSEKKEAAGRIDDAAAASAGSGGEAGSDEAREPAAGDDTTIGRETTAGEEPDDGADLSREIDAESAVAAQPARDTVSAGSETVPAGNEEDDPLVLLERILPGCGIASFENQFLLPWFARFFKPDSPFPPEIKCVHSDDPFAVVIVIHRLIYALFSCVNGVALEKFMDNPDYRVRLIDVKSAWQRIEVQLFTPYLAELAAIMKRLSTQEDRTLFKERHEHAVQWKIDAMRKHLVKYYRGASDGLTAELARKGVLIPQGFEGPDLFTSVEEAANLSDEIYEQIPKNIGSDSAPEGFTVYRSLFDSPVVELGQFLKTRSVEYHPIAVELKRFIEESTGKSIDTVSIETHELLFRLLSRLTELYRDLTMSIDSPLTAEAPLVAGEDEAIAWAHYEAGEMS